jgi:glycosyltransferase involved in cell wall biosynthesis
MFVSSEISVLFAIPALDRGGPDRVLFELLSRLDRRRFRPSVMVGAPTGHYLSRLPGDVSVTVLGDSGRRRDRYPALRALRALWRARPDVVFATLRMQLALGMVAPAFPPRTRLVLRPPTPHSSDFAALIARSPIKHRMSRALALATLRRADAIVCQSRVMYDDYREVLGDERKLRVIGNPIDTASVARIAAREVALPGSPALVSVGRFWPVKGYDILLAALPVVRARHPGLHLTIYGEGPDRPALEAQARSLGIADAVTFAGFNPDPLPSVRAADLFVLASRYEAFPNAALEALACGTPVVLTSCFGANRQIVEPGANGRLAETSTSEDVARALGEAIGELARYDAAHIIADTEARFGAQQIVRAYEDVFASVVTPDILTR